MSRGVELRGVVVTTLSLLFIVAVLEYLSSPTLKISFMQLLVRQPRRHPVLGREFGSISITRIRDAFWRLRYTISGVFLGYVLMDGYRWSVGLVSWVLYIVPPYIPNSRLHNQKVSWVYRWEFKYLVGYLSDRYMIQYGGLYYVCFWLILQAKSFVLFWVVVFELLQCQVLIPYLP